MVGLVSCSLAGDLELKIYFSGIWTIWFVDLPQVPHGSPVDLILWTHGGWNLFSWLSHDVEVPHPDV